MGFTPEIGSSVPKIIGIRPLSSHQTPVNLLIRKLNSTLPVLTAAAPATCIVKKIGMNKIKLVQAYYTNERGAMAKPEILVYDLK
jgi:hypothetical protein